MKDKFLFIHIHKCGGTSLKSLFRKIDNVTFYEGLESNYLCDRINDELSSYKKFTFVRNPYTRFDSLNKMLLSQKKNLTPNQILDIIEDEKQKYDSLIGKSYIKRHGLPATHKHYSVYNESNKTLNVDYVFKLEEMNKSIKKLELLLGLQIKVPHLNKSQDIKIISDKQVVSRINKIYSLDFEVFGYNKKIIKG